MATVYKLTVNDWKAFQTDEVKDNQTFQWISSIKMKNVTKTWTFVVCVCVCSWVCVCVCALVWECVCVWCDWCEGFSKTVLADKKCHSLHHSAHETRHYSDHSTPSPEWLLGNWGHRRGYGKPCRDLCLLCCSSYLAFFLPWGLVFDQKRGLCQWYLH